ncbi:MAG TPA: hypothetical protein VHE35_06370 [Kofleriaceae bacterium]|nr:hypothetical protein [Kofleriaceae bacterium]
MAALGVAACAHPRPVGPSPATRAAITEAEDALSRRDHTASRAAYDRAVAQAPDAASEAFARKERASTLLLWDDLPAAADDLARVTVLTPGDPAAWHDLGIVRHSLGDDDGARVALEHARALRPRDPRPRLALAALAWSHGDRAGAAAEYRALAELDLPDRLREKVEWALKQLATP